MPKPNWCQFVLLGCATSNLATDSYPFVVVVLEWADNPGLKSYVLNGWQNIREFFPDDLREDVLYFLDSLSDYSPGPEAERFFAHLQTLSIGPIRFISSRACGADELDGVLSAILESGENPVLWPESFSAI